MTSMVWILIKTSVARVAASFLKQSIDRDVSILRQLQFDSETSRWESSLRDNQLGLLDKTAIPFVTETRPIFSASPS